MGVLGCQEEYVGWARAQWKRQKGMALASKRLKIDQVRRAEIGAEKRLRTHAQLIDVASNLFGQEGGRTTRIEDVCERATVARGTFYNYFPSMDALQSAIFEHLSDQFDAAVHLAFERLDGPGEQTAAAIRYYLHHAFEDRRWGWGMVNTGMGIGLLPAVVSERVLVTIQEGIDQGEFNITSAEAGRDILLGSGLAAAVTLLKGGVTEAYIAVVTRSVLQALGCSNERASELSAIPLPRLADFLPA